MGDKMMDPAPFHHGKFHNLSGPAPHGLGAVLRYMRTRPKSSWPRAVAAPFVTPPPPRQDGPLIRATPIGHATVLLQLGGLNILTDPVWSSRIGPTSWLGIKRVRPPAFPLAQCPPIDVILLSHNHYDHLDRPTLQALERRDHPLLLTGLKVRTPLPKERVIELDWWQAHQFSPVVRITYVPAQHFSGRGLWDRNASLWGGFVLETPQGIIYFAGDTGAGEHVALIRQHFGPITLALLPIGAYLPRWFMAPVHVDPQEALAASLELQAQVSLAIHYGAFPLADEGIDAPLSALTQALAVVPAGLRGRDFRTPPWGEAVTLSASAPA